jgi:hypothetical protein
VPKASPRLALPCKKAVPGRADYWLWGRAQTKGLAISTSDLISDDVEPHYDVIVVGAGMGGIYGVFRFRQQGLSVLGLEGASGVGGVWYQPLPRSAS